MSARQAKGRPSSNAPLQLARFPLAPTLTKTGESTVQENPDSSLPQEPTADSRRKRRLGHVLKDFTLLSAKEVLIASVLVGSVFFVLGSLINFFCDREQEGLLKLFMCWFQTWIILSTIRWAQQYRRDQDEAERERHGFTLDDGRKATDGATEL